MAKKIKYLSYIEDTKKHHTLIEKEAKIAVKKAIADAHKKKIPVTYMEGEQIIKEQANGKKEVIGKVRNDRRKVTVGEKTTISKK